MRTITVLRVVLALGMPCSGAVVTPIAKRGAPHILMRRRACLQTIAAGVFLWQFRPEIAHASTDPANAYELTKVLVAIVSARETSARLERDIEQGRAANKQREIVKQIVLGLSLRDKFAKAVIFLPTARQEEGRVAASSALEYLAQVVEYDGFDEIKKSYASNNVAARRTTPESLAFAARALEAAVANLDSLLQLFPAPAIQEARGLYARLYTPVEEQEGYERPR